MNTVVALFIDSNGVYPEKLGSAQCWDVERDAKSYEGDHPVIAHPPCNLWVNLAAVNWARYRRQIPAWYPGGTDGGCFQSALASVRRCGGVLEHPAYSHAWQKFGLQKPARVGWQPSGPNQWVCEVWQSAYGHLARKKTWLYVVSASKPRELNWRRAAGSHVIGGGRTGQSPGRPKLCGPATKKTPESFADALIQIARDSYLPLQTSVQCVAPGRSAPGQSEGVQPAGRTDVDYD